MIFDSDGITVADPLRATLPLPYQHVLFPFGFPVQIKSNDSMLIRWAERSWGRFQQRFRDTPIEVRFLVFDFVARRRPPVPVFRAQSSLLTLVADAHNFACCDLNGGFGFACLTKGTVANHDYVRYYFLESMVCCLLDNLHLVALRAACVVNNGCGFLFVGHSGAGKSTLAYACTRRGWTYLSDDASSVVRRRAGRIVVGNPNTFRFRPDVSSLFPELQGQVKLRNGKPTVEIATDHLQRGKLAWETTIDHIVFLDRRNEDVSAPQLTRIRKEEALRRLCCENYWPPELPSQQERIEAIERLLQAETFQLTYKAFDPAIDLLEKISRRGAA
jgi:hypothetical protein